MASNLQSYVSPMQVREKIYNQSNGTVEKMLVKPVNNFSLTGGQKKRRRKVKRQSKAKKPQRKRRQQKKQNRTSRKRAVQKKRKATSKRRNTKFTLF